MKNYSPDLLIPGAIPGMVWPAVNGSSSSTLSVISDQLEKTQWWSKEQILEAQCRQLGKLCEFARKTTPFYMKRLSGLKIDSEKGIDLTEFKKLPILKRADLQNNFEKLQTTDLSLERGPIYENISSGSTGEPVKTKMSSYLNEVNVVLQRRWYDWVGLDGSQPMGYFTSKLYQKGDNDFQHTHGWHLNYPDNDYYVNNVSLSLAKKVKWLSEVRPKYVVTYPSYTKEMIQYAKKHEIDISSVEHFLLYGEPTMLGLREMAEEVCGAKLSDKYASRETGCIAIECPESGLLHVQGDNVYLEIIKDDGTDAKPGENGKVIVTSLTNTAMPLIRYELGDVAEAGPDCSCGRQQMTISNILGRTRDLIRLRGGDRVRPITNLSDKDAFIDVRKLQYVQKTYDDIVLRYVSDEPLSEDIQNRMIKAGEEMFPTFNFNVTLERVDDIPQKDGGKLRDIISEVTEET
ncbi:phenylacetate--CoA ligase family protein [Pseudemcibacter aquimaris]|uniref:phenylacetate--CoA ligase family protein n=1 Tax=Pseudemcibacter aquimaris TaxID=2857064 RepID=UPI002012C686|nr:hypothetical protein [Pseudemcibacter aquimaris]MCC3861294.1 hypothetical protein [Pseudemcibacter aquimaris]WDU58068.1 hypothetical protein KW060_12790 [Pseudemcibacter aquimaris]